MGRYLDVAGHPGNPLQGLSLDDSLAPALATTRVPVAAVSSPSDYNFWAYGLDEPLTGPTMEEFGALGSLSAPSPALAQARGAAQNTDIIRTQIAPFGEHEGKPGFTSPVTYPTSGGEFPQRLAVLAAMIDDEALPIKCVSMSAVGGYDTHSDEVETLATNLGQTVESVLAFQRDLEARGIDDRVVIQLWSEFGRRPEENGSGTDHGAAGVSFLIGSRVKGQMVGEFPGLTKLDPNENLVNTSDFRALYAGVLGQWFQTEAGPRDPRRGHRPARPEHLRHGPRPVRLMRGWHRRIALLLGGFASALLCGVAIVQAAPTGWGTRGGLDWGALQAQVRAHADARKRCSPRAHASHGHRRCAHKPRHGTSSTSPTAGPAPEAGGGSGGPATGEGLSPTLPGVPGPGSGGSGGGAAAKKPAGRRRSRTSRSSRSSTTTRSRARPSPQARLRCSSSTTARTNTT